MASVLYIDATADASESSPAGFIFYVRLSLIIPKLRLAGAPYESLIDAHHGAARAIIIFQCAGRRRQFEVSPRSRFPSAKGRSLSYLLPMTLLGHFKSDYIPYNFSPISATDYAVQKVPQALKIFINFAICWQFLSL